MEDLKLEVLACSPEARPEIMAMLDDFEAYEQTSLDGKRLIEIWVKPIAKSASKLKEIIMQACQARKITKIKVTKGGSTVEIDSLHPDDIEKIEKFLHNVLNEL